MSNPLLFSAVLAFSAVHLARLLPSHTEFQYIAEFYHLESVRRLIAITDNRNDELVRDGATLASTCLLRSYEILARKYNLPMLKAYLLTQTESVGSQSHLHGSFSFLVGQQINLGSDLLSAGFWNYLREDITVALIDKRPLKIDLSTVWMPRPVEDDDWSNMISLLLGKVINICLGDDARTVSFSEWKSLKDQVDEWRRSLPVSFEPVSPLPTGGPPKSSFPELWLFRGWHSKYSLIYLRYSTTCPRRIFLVHQLTIHISTISCRSSILSHSHDHPDSIRAGIRIPKRMAADPADAEYPP